MGYQDGYVMRTINDLVRVIARSVLDKNNIDYELPKDKEEHTPLDRAYRQLKDLADADDINEAGNFLSDQLGPSDLGCLEMALIFYMYLNQFSDDIPYQANHSREEIADGISSVYTEYGISGLEYPVDTAMI